MAERPKLQPLTINIPRQQRDDLQRIADQEILSLSDVARRAFRTEILRVDREKDDGDDR